MAGYDYDLFVIGGGSGGVRAGRVSASLGKKVGIAEEFRYGGTCVIRGCVPKKLLVYASQFPDHFEDAAGYGWSVPEASFDWGTLIANKDREIARLETIYRDGLMRAGAETFASRAELVGPHEIRLVAENRTVTAETILIATGGRPNPHASLTGHELCITSNEAFHLDTLPKAIVIAGGGYIAVEFANIFHGLGVETTLVYRGQEILGGFDMDLRTRLHEAMAEKGISVRCHTIFDRIEKRPDGRLAAHLSNDEVLVADQVMLALGRTPNTEGLGLDKAGVELGKLGEIVVDEFSRTNIPHIYAIGDVTNRVQLTPVAIHEAMCFVDTVFRDKPTSPDHDIIATAVFSQPEIGTVGMTEEAAAHAFDEVDVYLAGFRPMKTAFVGRPDRMMMKLIVDAATRKVVGAHVLGLDAGEMAQLLGVAVKAGLTKDDFDRTMAIHPTAAEEMVTIYQPSYRLKGGVKVQPA